jgi:uncharacterized protein (DUF302 family)
MENEMDTQYGFGRTSERSFDDALAHVISALQQEGFGILSDIDVSGTAEEEDRH